MLAKKISIKNAKEDKLFYFVANVVVYREKDGRCLILKRSEREKVHPGRWAVLGGKLEWGQFDIRKPSRLNGDVIDFENAVEDLLIREVKEEAGIEIFPDFKYINSNMFIRPDETPVVLVKFAARYKKGLVVAQPGDFTDFAWANEKEIKKYPCLDGIPKEVKTTVKMFKK